MKSILRPVDQMKVKNGAKLAIVIILPGKMEAFFEELSLGLTQMRMTRSLRKVADDTGRSETGVGSKPMKIIPSPAKSWQ